MAEDMDQEQERMLAAEYTLGLLTPAEARAFEDLLDIDPSARGAYAFWADHFAALTDDIPEVAPPDALLPRIEETLFTAPESDTPTSVAKPSLLERLGLLPAMAGGLLAALAVLWVVNFAVVDTARDTASVTLAAEEQGLLVEVAYVDGGATLQVNRPEGDIPAGQSLQLWLIRDDQPPISLGLLPDDRTGELQVAEAIQPLLRGARCGISVEAPGGSATGAPTGGLIAEARIIWDNV